MRDYTIFLDEIPNEHQPEAPYYQIALRPFVMDGGGAMGTKLYPTKVDISADMRRVLGYSDAAVERFFAANDRHQTLVRFSLSDEDADCLGWKRVYRG